MRWIVVYDDSRLEYPTLNTARGILGLPLYTDQFKGDADATISQILITDHLVPTSLRLRAVTSNLKLYEYLPNATP